jgi:hypothetical protein
MPEQYGGGECRAVDEAVALPLLGVGYQFTVDELLDRLAKRLVLGLQNESFHLVVSLSILSSHLFTDLAGNPRNDLRTAPSELAVRDR